MNIIDKYKSNFISSVGDILSEMSKECENIANQKSKEQIIFSTNTRFLNLKIFRIENNVYFKRSFGNQIKTTKIVKKTKFTFFLNKTEDILKGFDISTGSTDDTYANIEIQDDGSLKVDFSDFSQNIEGNITEVESNIDSNINQIISDFNNESNNINSQLTLILSNQNEILQTIQTQYKTLQDNFEFYKNLYKSSVLEIENNINSDFDNIINTMQSEFNQLENIITQYTDVTDVTYTPDSIVTMPVSNITSVNF